MSSLDIPSASLSQEETVPIALLLAFVGGYLDAYTWIIHGVMANAQTANLVLLWVYGASGKWDDALHFAPSIAAFATGILSAAWLRRVAGRRTSTICALVEIVLLVAIGVLHNRLPDLAGTLGISFVAAVQTAVFTKVDGAAYSSVMVTGNMRQAIEGVFLAASGGGAGRPLRRSGIFAGLCISFGVGAAVGAFATKGIPDIALGVPATALVLVLLHSGFERSEVPA